MMPYNGKISRSNTNFNHDINSITMEPHTEQIFKLECHLKHTDPIRKARDVKLPHALVKVNSNVEFPTG